MNNQKQVRVCQCCGWPLADEWFDDARHVVRGSDGGAVKVPKLRWEMLSFFRDQPGQLVTFDKLWNKLYFNREDPPLDNTMWVHIHHLRRELSATPYRIVTRARKGYVFDMERPA